MPRRVTARPPRAGPRLVGGAAAGAASAEGLAERRDALGTGAVPVGAVSDGGAAVPPRLKFWSSRGPIVSRDGAVVGGGGAIRIVGGGADWSVFCGMLWASAGEPSESPAANASIPKR